MTERLAQLEKYAREDPHDPFNHYAVALEILNLNKPLAIERLQQLVLSHPAYLPAYYMLAQTLAELGRQHEAEKIFTAGIELARTLGDVKTLRELQAALEFWQS
jgi:predicted Zn-dependent protease